jgi:hypothetical protein
VEVPVFIYSVADAEVPPTSGSQRRQWHAVEVVAGNGACKAASAWTGCRLLSRAAPRLPLAECDVARCTCKYRHFGDRRHADRRGHPPSVLPQQRAPSERRGRRGRRASD